ncbi:hypothetical protein [Stigmatella aurantiaca]|uniref:Uncharacterized protein n=1 Tax=Stigmatella aurantiaca (strain DW4/3-1) TaxID=378806 RepID=Q093Y2_STIAD|nr:hypothetical protein [Stigmatella aurantiaca]EAU67015.1 hypothetical protein STIAU_3498 [Stigmatella aurantiaca DW4/3-1]
MRVQAGTAGHAPRGVRWGLAVRVQVGTVDAGLAVSAGARGARPGWAPSDTADTRLVVRWGSW